MRVVSPLLAGILISLVTCDSLRAAEIDGKVQEAVGKTVTISTDSEWLPVVGDPVDILVSIPGLGDLAKVGSGQVTAIDGLQITAEISQATGKIAAGQLARITSTQPVRRPGPPPLAPSGADTPAPPDVDTPAPQTPTSKHKQIAKVVATLAGREHLSRHPLDDEIGRRMLRIFLNSLDANKRYFTTGDVTKLRRSEEDLDNDLRRGELAAVYEMVNTYLRRAAERYSLAVELIDMDHDFTVDESIVNDPDAVDFPNSETEIREAWRKYVKYQLLVHMAAGTDLEEARRRTRRQYRSQIEKLRQWDGDDILEFILSAVATAYDPQSKYISAKTYQNFVINQQQQLEGIGAALQLVDGYAEVTKIIAGGPADRDGQLKAGDRISAVVQGDQGEFVDVVGMKLADTVSMMRGKKGTTVRLRVLPKGVFESKVYKITRDKVELATIDSLVVPTDKLPDGREARLGYIYLPSFYGAFAASGDAPQNVPSSTADVKRILDGFKQNGVQVVILDLSGNGGGSLTESLNVAGLFLGNVNLLQVKDGDGKVEIYGAPDINVAWDGPLVVRTSRVTSGGSEILAAAIQDYRRGLIVGDVKTHGYGTVQRLLDLGRELFNIPSPPNLGYLKLTHQRFYRPTGTSTQLAGVSADVALPSLTTHMDIGEDSQLYALSTDVIAAAQFEATDYGIDEDMIGELVALSEERRANSPFFQELHGKIEKYKVAKSRKQISLQQDEFFASRRTDATDDEEPPMLSEIADVKLTGDLQEVFAITLDYLSRTSYAEAENAYKSRRFAEAIRKYQTAVTADPSYATGHYKLAWSLSTCPDASIRDGERAVEHAQRACELDRHTRWSFILALAIAQAEAGNFDGAQERLKDALEKAPEEQRSAYRFLERKFQNGQRYQSP